MKQSMQFRNLFLSWKSCFTSMKQGRILLLFLSYAILQVLFILTLMYFTYPPFSYFLVPVIKKVFGEPALHYPNYYLVLPSLFFWINLLLSGFLGIVLVAATTRLFSRSFNDKPETIGKGIKRILPAYSFLFVAWLVETSLLLAVFLGLPKLLQRIEFFAARGPLAVQLVTSMFAMVAGALFLYTTALIVLDRKGPLQALAQSLSLFAKYPVISFLLIAIPNFIRMPIDVLSGKTQFLISKFNPEMVGVVLILSVLISVFANYLMVGAVTRYFLLLKEKRY